MLDKPYFCPNCRSNRVKFGVISKSSQFVMKDAISGEITSNEEPQPIEQNEPDIQCQVCGFVGNEMRFVKQAEREPRSPVG